MTVDLRDRYDAQQLERRRLALALRRGTQHDSLLREAHPVRFVLGGLGVALLVLLVAAVVGLVAPREPAGWRDPGRLVLDAAAGQRYVVDPQGVLRPVLNETSLRLLYPGAVPTPVTVADDLVRRARRGAPVGRTDVPFEPPTLLAAGTPQQRCQSGDTTVAVLGGAGSGAGAAVLVRRGTDLALLTGRRLYPLADPVAAQRLGLAPELAVPVPAVLLEQVRPGPALQSLTVPVDPDPAVPALQREGTLVTGATSGASYVVAGGRLRALPNRTAVQLVFGPEPPAAVTVPEAALRTAPRGDAVVPAGVPRVPPTPAVLPAGGALCVSSTGDARVLAALPGRGALRPDATSAVATPAGAGLLLAASAAARERPSEQAPVVLVAEGRAYPITSEQVLHGLGYASAQVQVVSAAFAGLAPAAPVLQEISLAG